MPLLDKTLAPSGRDCYFNIDRERERERERERLRLRQLEGNNGVENRA